MNESMEGSRSLSQQLASPWRTPSKLPLVSDGALRPRVGGGGFLAWEGQGLATDLPACFNKKLTGGPVQRAALRKELEIQGRRGRMVLRPRAWVVLLLGQKRYQGLEQPCILCVRRRDVQGGPSLSSYSATLMDSPAPVLINLSGHKPGKSVYLCLGTRTQVPHMPCMCFPLSLLCYQRSIFTGRKKIYMDNQPFHSLNFFSLL